MSRRLQASKTATRSGDPRSRPRQLNACSRRRKTYIGHFGNTVTEWTTDIVLTRSTNNLPGDGNSLWVWPRNGHDVDADAEDPQRGDRHED